MGGVVVGTGGGGRVTRPKQPSGPSNNFSNISPTPAAQLPNTNLKTFSKVVGVFLLSFASGQCIIYY